MSRALDKDQFVKNIEQKIERANTPKNLTYEDQILFRAQCDRAYAENFGRAGAKHMLRKTPACQMYRAIKRFLIPVNSAWQQLQKKKN